MEKYLEIFINGYRGYANYLWQDITNPSWNSYFYWLLLVSLLFFVLEVMLPWRKNQGVLRKDFWLDTFYMFFNFFLFSLLIYNAASDVVVNLFNDGILAISGVNLKAINPMQYWPYWAVLLTGLVLRDFVQWWIHRLLHRVDFLWEYHKVHHSVAEMGFAAQLRYHWMENVVYRSLEYIPLALLGIGLYDFFVIHIFTLAWGHYNHANLRVSEKWPGAVIGLLLGIILANGLLEVNLLVGLGWIEKTSVILSATAFGAFILSHVVRTLFNSPEMHIWHHSYHLPAERRNGVNFGLTLAVWDYIFGTAYIPYDGRDIKLGFPGVESFPEDFAGQNIHGFSTVSQSVSSEE
ncbi:MAG: sterol desaturase family protein [Saprospiraceae bacterium]